MPLGHPESPLIWTHNPMVAGSGSRVQRVGSYGPRMAQAQTASGCPVHLQVKQALDTVDRTIQKAIPRLRSVRYCPVRRVSATCQSEYSYAKRVERGGRRSTFRSTFLVHLRQMFAILRHIPA